LRRASLNIRRSVWGGGVDDALPHRAPAAPAAAFPLIVYHAGWPGTEVDNFRLIVDLASRGHIVAALLYADTTPMSFESDADSRRTVELAARRVRSRARDTSRLLDELLRPEAQVDGWRLQGLLDAGSIGVLGFSFGGAIAAETATYDSRVGAAVNIDGRHWGAALEQGVPRPYLYVGAPSIPPTPADLESDQPGRRCDAALERRDQLQLAANLRRHGGLRVTIDGASHMNFTDCALRFRLRRMPGTGRVVPRRAFEITAAYVAAFFAQQLRGTPSPLLAPRSQPYREARLEIWGRSSPAG
jgi:dienelactone hydrolase